MIKDNWYKSNLLPFIAHFKLCGRQHTDTVLILSIIYVALPSKLKKAKHKMKLKNKYKQ